MKQYKISFEARLKGAIGKSYKYSKTVKADTFKEAVLSLYNDFDHVHVKAVNGVKYDPLMNQLK